ncbi:MAG TPA: DUF4097 family beta strand repeat-containing protein [Vicinamibacterales bacterium]|nr:DUF4097 family beta strand repeat-containing protein [Vicinamibacterales bacterium]
MALVTAAAVTSADAAQDRGNDAQQQPPIQARPGGPETSPRTDQTVDVTKGTRLVLSNNAGEVVVRSWDRDQVRVQATHNERVTIDVASADSTLRVRSRASRGPAGLVDFQLTVPRWMPVNLSGTYLESTIEGTTAEVTVESVHGNIRVVGGSGNINLRSVQGIITVDKASGNVRATTINEGIRLTDISGDVYAETTNGDIEVQNAQTSSLEISTVNGDVTFNGTMRDAGSYRLTTHGGDIRLGLGGVNNATVFVRTFQGDFMADFPIQLPEGQSAREGSKRFNFTLGSGSARIELQTFNGDIALARKAIVSAQELRRQRRRETPKATPAPAPKPPKPPGMQLAGMHWPDHGDLDLDFDVDFDFDFDFDFQHHPDIPRPPAPPAPPPAPKAPEAPAVR